MNAAVIKETVEIVTPRESCDEAGRRLSRSKLRQGFKLTLHRWREADGVTRYFVIRMKHPDTGEKWVRPMHLNDAGEYVLEKPPAPETGRLLYNLPALLAADPETLVFVVEGEGKVDALAKLDILATTSGNSTSAEAADWTPVQGHRCIVWPDHDTSGMKYAAAVAEKLQAQDCAVRLIAPEIVEALLEKADVVDWLAENPNATAADILELATVEPPSKSNPVKNSRDSRDSRDNASQAGLGGSEEPGQNRDSRDSMPGFEPNKEGERPGVYWCDVIKDGEAATRAWICSPLSVEAMTRDAQNGEWGRLLVFTDSDGNEHRWTCPQSMHAGSGDELRAVLLREGLTITTSPKLRRKVGDYIQQQAPNIRARCVNRTGWHGDVFVLPRETIGDSDAAPVLFQTASIDGATLGKTGTFEGWREGVAAPCAGNSRLVLALSMALAGPCVGMVDAEGGGLHLRGSSSTGKSTALRVAASVYGSPAYVRTWRTTDNGLEGVAAMHSDMLLALDEIGQLEPKHAGQVAYMLANGQGKSRSRRDGSPRPVALWRVLFLSAGEIGLSELVTQSGGKVRAGQEVRVIDLPADAGTGLGLFNKTPGSPATFADNLKAEAATHYGHALPAFVEALVEDPAKARETLRALRADIAGELMPTEASGQVRRVADRFALIGAAGELATAYGLTGWTTNEAAQAVQVCFGAWLDARGTAGDAEPAAMLAQVRGFLEANGEARFSLWNGSELKTINRAGFRKGDAGGGPTFYVERECFKREVCTGFDPQAVAHVLAERGALATDRDGTTRKERLPDGRHVRVYVITPKLWEEA